ncbi:helix-turn-helix domain-containing protein [Streptomyces similanensis]|uniref:Uncharacterized protein n=1 Tax=Streptomyces similanensis TaxID=1274988 RepID=A0ABP9KCZ3_9ACTN
MPKDQQPDDEPTVAEYQRADASKFPTHPAGQQGAVEGMLAAYNRSKLAQSIEADTSIGRFQLSMLAAFEEYEHARRLEIIAAGGDPDEDRDPFETVRAIADGWAASADDEEARAALLDHLADSLDTSEVRALRLAAEAAAAITPRLILADAEAGARVADTADDLGVSERYVYRVLREQRAAQQQDEPAWCDRKTSGGHDWHRKTPSAGMRCRLCDLPFKDWSGEDCPDAQ